MTLVLAAMSDMHCGSTVALHPAWPTPLDDGGEYSPSSAQEWMWDHWISYAEKIADTADGAPVHLILNGDLVDGDHHGTAQIVSRHPNTQLDILKEAMRRMLDITNPTSVVVVRGTEVHVGKSGSAEESFARWLVAQGISVPPAAGTGNLSHWHFRGEYEGVLVDAAHHGRIGQRPWTKINATLSLAAQITMEHAMTGERVPDLAIRSHYHQWADTNDAYPTRVIQTPAWQLATAYVHKVAPGALADIGGAIITIDDGDILSVRKVLAKVERVPTQVVV